VLGAALLVPVVVAAFVVRVIAVAVLRRRHPAAAAFVARNWTWLPLLAVVVLLMLWSWPVGALAAAIATVIVARPGAFGLPSQ
jgi:hypothetical protein